MVSTNIDTIDQENQLLEVTLVAKVFKAKIVYSDIVQKLPSIPSMILTSFKHNVNTQRKEDGQRDNSSDYKTGFVFWFDLYKDKIKLYNALSFEIKSKSDQN